MAAFFESDFTNWTFKKSWMSAWKNIGFLFIDFPRPLYMLYILLGVLDKESLKEKKASY